MKALHTFIFDFDSTIFPGETLDEIIQFQLKSDPQQKVKSEHITEICNLGMSGTIPMNESLKRRLEIAGPHPMIIAQYVEANQNRIVPAMKSLLKELHEFGYTVYVVSGGFEEWIKQLLLGIIPHTHIRANRILNHAMPMTYDNIQIRSKEEIIKNLVREENHTTIIGDGATDFSVFEKGLAQEFVGTFFYTGTESRKNIVEKALSKKQLTFSELEKFIEHMYSFI